MTMDRKTSFALLDRVAAEVDVEQHGLLPAGVNTISHRMVEGIGPTEVDAVTNWLSNLQEQVADVPNAAVVWRQFPEINRYRDFEANEDVFQCCSRVLLFSHDPASMHLPRLV